MGAFENQIRENETFDSLLELYRKSFRLREDLTTESWKLKKKITAPFTAGEEPTEAPERVGGE